MTDPVRIHRALFLDRDGTLIEDVGYPSDPEQVRLLPGVADALRYLQQRGLVLVVVSNQSGIGRGRITQEQADAVHARFLNCLHQAGVTLMAAYYCPHAPEEGCRCRKPSPGMLQQAANDWGIALEQSFLVGDKLSDIEAGQRVGCFSLLLSPEGPVSFATERSRSVASWREAVQALVAELQARERNRTRETE